MFESLHQDDEEILKHADLNDEDQTVVVEMPVPDTGASTKKDTSAIGATNIAIVAGVAIFVSLGGYLSIRFIARRKIFKNRL